ncbi:3-hydroxyisobutyrate dehydrogenase [Streptomyces sp. SID13031]|uniref:3-hydroxyisobutyrate dehydrogenase n=1 Tax=Streptomyces sp. SID13031 TaxID=2706046 RepID=UPI0013C62115|nr:3-hydroxyisobutyrate dehydrogenase [Streptomyces sp. SID13031]NEA30220.1 3-hydroxyisobutyrate dehydrogenase [Streptomyces sp. SID13031]
MTAVGFIGLGNMGGPMAANLVKAGFTVTGFDPSDVARSAAVEAGVAMVATPAEAVAGADVVITMLPSGRHVLEVYQGEDGLLASAPAGALFVDCSTIAVSDAREAAALVVSAGHRALDAPVSGGVVGATAGTLTLMVGALDEDLAAVREVLEPMAGRIVHCGEPGAGQAAKICNNLILGISMIGVSEAFVLGEKLGLSHQALYDVTSTASGQCWSLTTNCPVPGPVPTSPANRDYQPGFAAPLMAKDLGLAIQAAETTGTTANLGTLAAALYREFADGNGSGLDFSAIINSIREGSQA